MVWHCLSLIPVALLICLGLSVFLLRWSPRLGLLDRGGTEPHKRSGRAVPNTGGIGIFWAVTGPVLTILVGAWLLPPSWWLNWSNDVALHVQGLRRIWVLGAGVLGAMAAMHLLGLYDDQRPLRAWVKLVVELAVALALVVLCDMRVLVFLGERFGMGGTVISLALSVVWIVVVVNAFNMLDNMDGLTTGVAAICTSLYLAATLLAGQWFVASMAALLLGALLGFAPFNLSRARMYMGDGGALVVGMLVAVISIRTTYFAPDIANKPGHWYGVLMPLMLLAIPLYDFISVSILRLVQGRRPWWADRQHFSHRLVQLGLSQRSAVAVIWLCTAATGLSGVMLGTLAYWQAIIAAIQAMLIVAMLAMLEWAARVRRGSR